MEPLLGHPGGVEWAIIWSIMCCMALPSLLLVAGILFIVKQTGSNGTRHATAGPSAPAAWHPDPTGRHELRYWNGQAWTQAVSDGGEQSEDPL